MLYFRFDADNACQMKLDIFMDYQKRGGSAIDIQSHIMHKKIRKIIFFTEYI